jgi:hypothetical protein
MKRIKSNKLKPGMVVSDIKPGHAMKPVYLKFVKRRKGQIYFEYISGPTHYKESPLMKGLIGFFGSDELGWCLIESVSVEGEIETMF